MTSAIERALTYPYDAPPGSYLFTDGKAQPYRPPSAMAEQRFPIIGYGSNRAPAQLARKYPDAAERIPVEFAWLDGFDVVYAARIGGYGAVPATVAPCPGCRLPVMLTWLSLAQLPAMHRSEGIGVAYDFGALEAPIQAEHSGPLPHALIYVGKTGAYAPDNTPIGLAEIAAEGRSWPALRQRQIQQRLADEFLPGQTLEAFVDSSINDKAAKTARSGRMGERALLWQDSRFRPLRAEDPL